MSVINKMLQELDRRQAIPDPDGALAPKHVRPVEAERQGQWFWASISVLMLAAVGWVGWVAYQLQPHPIATEKAFKAADEARAKSAAVVVRSDVPASAPPQPSRPGPGAPETVAQPKSEEARSSEGTVPPGPKVPAAPASEASSNVAAPVAAEPSEAKTASAAAPAGNAIAESVAPKPRAQTKATAERIPRAAPDTISALGLPPAKVLLGTSRVERRDRASAPRDTAERDFRVGVDMLKHGRPADAEVSFRAAIAKDPSHRAARQALVALSLDAGHLDSARGLLQDGLSLDPAQADFAFILARILVERQDYAGALSVLQGAASGATNMAEYQALRGAVLQKLNRYEESALAYQAALQIQSALPAAWVGLGISLEATEHRREAAEAFRRALQAGPMAEDLKTFAEQRARALR